MKLAGWLFEHAQLLIVLFFLATMALLCYTIISKSKELVTMDKARREYRKELEETYRQGWKDGFNAFLNRTVTTDNVSFKIEEDVARYFEEVSHE